MKQLRQNSRSSVVSKSFMVSIAQPIVLVGILLTSGNILANEGFTEPYRKINVAGSDSGIISEMLVVEGSIVSKGQPLVQLDVDVQESLLAIAEASKEAHGRADAAAAEVAIRQHTLTALSELETTGHARPEEVERARADLAIAKGQLTAAREQQRLKELEYDKIRVQIDRRTIRAPLDGVVTTVLKHVGEFTAPNDPNLLVIVQLDPLYATFDIVSSDAKQLSVGDSVSVTFLDNENDIVGDVEYISPVVDAESGTVAVKVKLPNAHGKLQSGQACKLVVQ